MRQPKRFEIIVPITGDKYDYREGAIRPAHIADVTVCGIAYNRDGGFTYDIDEAFVKVAHTAVNLECKNQMEALYGPMCEDDRFDGPITAHIPGLFEAGVIELTDITQDAA